MIFQPTTYPARHSDKPQRGARRSNENKNKPHSAHRTTGPVLIIPLNLGRMECLDNFCTCALILSPLSIQADAFLGHGQLPIICHKYERVHVGRARASGTAVGNLGIYHPAFSSQSPQFKLERRAVNILRSERFSRAQITGLSHRRISKSSTINRVPINTWGEIKVREKIGIS